jgi:8-amino-7-oxononanoate synthase
LKEVIYIDHLPGRTIQVEGEEYLYCSGTSYLGMAKNEAFTALLQQGMARYGTNYSSSRISNLQLQVYEEVESYLAKFTGAQAAVTLSSGFLTGQMVVHLLDNKTSFMYAPRTHPAVWRSTEDFFDADFNTWTLQVLELISASK